MMIVSWNVNGLRAVLRRDQLSPMLKRIAADVVLLQETKAQPEQVDLTLPSHPWRYYNSARRKGYSGVATFCRDEPLSVVADFGDPEHDGEGRALAIETPDFWIASVYVPNARRDLSRLPLRQRWDRALLAWLRRLERHKPVVVGGDFNVAHREIDLARPRQNRGKHGFTDEERSGFQALLDAGWIDSLRHVHGDRPGLYTWWKQYGGARERNVGWRIDYLLASAALAGRIRGAATHPDIPGSDHCPVSVDIAC